MTKDVGELGARSDAISANNYTFVRDSARRDRVTCNPGRRLPPGVSDSSDPRGSSVGIFYISVPADRLEIFNSMINKGKIVWHGGCYDSRRSAFREFGLWLGVQW